MEQIRCVTGSVFASVWKGDTSAEIPQATPWAVLEASVRLGRRVVWCFWGVFGRIGHGLGRLWVSWVVCTGADLRHHVSVLEAVWNGLAVLRRLGAPWGVLGSTKAFKTNETSTFLHFGTHLGLG